MRAPAVLLLAVLLGCPTGGDDDSNDDDTADDDTADDDSDEGGVVGGVQVMEMVTDNPPGGTSPSMWVWGIFDRPMVGQILGVVAEMMWEPTIVEGDCVYLEAMIPGFCDPPCEFEDYCTPDGVCEPWPSYRQAGVMTLEGLTETLTLTPHESGFYLATDLPADLFETGATVTLLAEGGETPAFEIATLAPPPLEPGLDCQPDLPQGHDLVVTWDADGGDATIRWEMISAFHAGDGPMVLCETEDDGELVVPAALIDAYLPDRSVYETFQLSRLRQAYAAVDHGNRVGLEVATRRICFHWPGE